MFSLFFEGAPSFPLLGKVMKAGKKMQNVENNNIPVVTEDYLEAVKKGGAQLLLTQYAIAPWRGDVSFVFGAY